MKASEVITHARLEGVYGVLRRVQANHDKFETRCIGSGECCKIGLVISLAECWNIAKQLRRLYYILAEDVGFDQADSWWSDQISLLKSALEIEWDSEIQKTEEHCVFFDRDDRYCTIYEFRPMVCRAYGVIAPVEEEVCPRKRLPDGGHQLIWDDAVAKTIEEFDSIIEQWGKDNPDLDYSIYMPAGVLRFLLSGDELVELIANTDEKFWLAAKGYKHQIHKDHWETLQIGRR